MEKEKDATEVASKHVLHLAELLFCNVSHRYVAPFHILVDL